MIKAQQKALIHIYKNAARLSDLDYRDVLRRNAAVNSAADRSITQAGYERAMATLETILFARVAAGEIPTPIGRSRWIRNEFYWRHKLPASGSINSRQAHLIERLWISLQEHLPPGARNLTYLAGILYRATGRRQVGYYALTIQQAACLIDALRDRLAHAISTPETAPK